MIMRGHNLSGAPSEAAASPPPHQPADVIIYETPCPRYNNGYRRRVWAAGIERGTGRFVYRI